MSINQRILKHHWTLAQRKSYTYPAPMVFALGIIYSDTMKKVLKGVCFELTLMVYRQGLGHWFATKESIAKLNAQAARLVQEDLYYTHQVVQKFKKISPQLLKFTREQIFSADLTSASPQKLWRLYERYLRLYEQIYTWGEPLTLGVRESVPAYLKEYLLTKLKDAERKDVNKHLNVLISPRQKSFVKKEEYDLLQIACGIEANQKLCQLFKTAPVKLIKQQFPKYPALARTLKNHTRRYCWVPYDYGVYLWNEDAFLRNLKDIIKSRKAKERLGEHEQYYQKLANQQHRLAKHLKIDERHQLLFKVVREAAFLLDYKKEIFTQSHYYFKNLLEEIGRRFGLSRELVQFYLPAELKRALLEGRHFSRRRLEKRFNKFAMFWDGRKVKIYEGAWVDELWEFLQKQEQTGQYSLLDGVIASPGKAVGRVKVVMDTKDIGKVRKGDILVAPMTSPDYLTGVRKAAAIITDEGGLTCHAAIVSREFGIPCVIGTKIASKVLKDGDLVEVNANHSSVKLIKRH